MDVRDLPALNATLNGTAAILLSIGWWLIVNGKREAHRKVMLAAFTVSAIFLTSYLIYHYNVGSVKFQKEGPIRTVYLTILLTHTILAVFVGIAAPMTLFRALKNRIPQHKKLARWTMPIWLYVSVTGVVVYYMLYQM
jgi:putative membrane protein